jgi:hypothetical protein
MKPDNKREEDAAARVIQRGLYRKLVAAACLRVAAFYRALPEETDYATLTAAHTQADAQAQAQVREKISTVLTDKRYRSQRDMRCRLRIMATSNRRCLLEEADELDEYDDDPDFDNCRACRRASLGWDKLTVGCDHCVPQTLARPGVWELLEEGEQPVALCVVHAGKAAADRGCSFVGCWVNDAASWVLTDYFADDKVATVSCKGARVLVPKNGYVYEDDREFDEKPQNFLQLRPLPHVFSLVPWDHKDVIPCSDIGVDRPYRGCPRPAHPYHTISNPSDVHRIAALFCQPVAPFTKDGSPAEKTVAEIPLCTRCHNRIFRGEDAEIVELEKNFPKLRSYNFFHDVPRRCEVDGCSLSCRQHDSHRRRGTTRFWGKLCLLHAEKEEIKRREALVKQQSVRRKKVREEYVRSRRFPPPQTPM